MCSKREGKRQKNLQALTQSIVSHLEVHDLMFVLFFFECILAFATFNDFSRIWPLKYTVLVGVSGLWHKIGGDKFSCNYLSNAQKEKKCFQVLKTACFNFAAVQQSY